MIGSVLATLGVWHKLWIMRRPPKPKIAVRILPRPPNRIDSLGMQRRRHMWAVRTKDRSQMEPEEESIVARTRRTIKSLPDPYGHGFARAKTLSNVHVKPRVKSERFRMKSGQIANNSFFLAFRNVVGFGIATTAVLLVINPTILPYTSPLFILAIWLIPALAAFVLLSQEAKQPGLQ